MLSYFYNNLSASHYPVMIKPNKIIFDMCSNVTSVYIIRSSLTTPSSFIIYFE